MSEFEGPIKPEPGERPNPEKLREMLEQHAYEAGTIFAKQGTKPYTNNVDWVNHGRVGDKQFLVVFQERETPAAYEGRDMHLLRVYWRPLNEDVADKEGWGERFSEERELPHSAMFLYDHNRPGIAGGNVKSAEDRMNKRAMVRRLKEDLKPGERSEFEEVNPEELAYIDSLLTQLTNQQPET